jgi:hypothetical protein
MASRFSVTALKRGNGTLKARKRLPADGDPKVRPETIEQVITLLQRPVPDANVLAGVLARVSRLQGATEHSGARHAAENDLFDALMVMFLEPRKWERADEAVRHAVGARTQETLSGFQTHHPSVRQLCFAQG